MYPWIKRPRCVSIGLCAGLCLIIDFRLGGSSLGLAAESPVPSPQVRLSRQPMRSTADRLKCLLVCWLQCLLQCSQLSTSTSGRALHIHQLRFPRNYDVCMVAAGVLSPSNDSVLQNVARNIWLKHLKSTSACEILNRCWRLWRA